jgi:membrane protein
MAPHQEQVEAAANRTEGRKKGSGLSRGQTGRSVMVLCTRTVWKECRIEEAIDMAAQVSFYFALSCFPFLIVLAALLGWLQGTENWEGFWYWLANYLPASSQGTIMTIMTKLSKGFGGFLSLGLLLTLWSASSGFQSLINALSRVYGVHETRSYARRRALAVAATLVAALFLLIGFALLSVEHLMAVFAAHYCFYFATPWKILRWVITGAMLVFGVDLVNYFFPAKPPPWRWVMPGSVLTVLCFLVASESLRLYVTYNHSMSRIYGTLTGFIVIMLWIYLANFSVLLGAQIHAVLLQLSSRHEMAA